MNRLLIVAAFFLTTVVVSRDVSADNIKVQVFGNWAYTAGQIYGPHTFIQCDRIQVKGTQLFVKKGIMTRYGTVLSVINLSIDTATDQIGFSIASKKTFKTESSE